MQTETAGRTERNLALLLILCAVALHGCAALSAGALWRDEANSIQQARLSSWAALGKSLEYDSFPALYPSVLRIWSGNAWAASDPGLRLFGFLTGMALLASIVFVARLLGTRWPAVALVLLGTNALWISEGDSIRPYGLSLLFLLWTYGFMGKALAGPSGWSLAAAALASVLAVQTSYTNAIFVGVICLCAAGVSLARRDKAKTWLSLVPGAIAAISLVPYVGILQRACEWAVIVSSRPDWTRILRGLMFPCTPLLLFVWLAFLILALCRLGAIRGEGNATTSLRVPILGYTLSVFVLGLAAQFLFVQAANLPLFPRYFLPVAMFGAFAFGSLLDEWKPRLIASAVLAALLLSAWSELPTLLRNPWPPWYELRMRHTNMDQVGAVLAAQASPRDLVAVSPWFLHTSFQRYYRGPAAWMSIPELEHQPIMGYGLIKRAMLEPHPESGTEPRLREVLQRGGTVWFVSQKRWSNLSREDAPEVPAPVPAPAGADYVRFRSYWEREIEYRLNACCVGSEVPMAGTRPVWDEEDLILTGWREKPR
jgi:hypothetical protein